jgi:hypothetical protein
MNGIFPEEGGEGDIRVIASKNRARSVMETHTRTGAESSTFLSR